MAALDTNILVCWLTDDDARQSTRVASLLMEKAKNGERLFVPVTVMLELEWVLRSRYRFDKAAITSALDALLSVTELEFQTEPALEQALWLFKQAGAPDFADCLHVALVSQSGQGPLLTFDERASKLEGAELLKAA
jgi:predicted nucleic-acid-binding protein